jgi:hypothetical protein
LRYNPLVTKSTSLTGGDEFDYHQGRAAEREQFRPTV